VARKFVIDAVEARLAAGWQHADVCPIYGINLEGEAPAGATQFLQVSYPLSTNAQISIGAPGNNLFREEGGFRLALNAERGEGIATALVWIEELADLFRGKVFDGVRTYAPTSPALDDRNDEGNYYVLSISVPYEADYFG
jgi:hypothetical protein